MARGAATWWFDWRHRFACRRERGGFNNDHDRTSGGLRLTRAFRDRSATETDMSSSTAAQMIKAIAARPQLRVSAWYQPEKRQLVSRSTRPISPIAVDSSRPVPRALIN